MSSYDKIYTAAKEDYEAAKSELRAKRDAGEISVDEWDRLDQEQHERFIMLLDTYLNTDATHVERRRRFNHKTVAPIIAEMETVALVEEWGRLTYIAGKAGVMPTPMAVRASNIMSELFGRGLTFSGTWE